MLSDIIRIQSEAILMNDMIIGSRCFKAFRGQTTEIFVLQTFISLAATRHMFT